MTDMKCYRCGKWPCDCPDHVTILEGDCRAVLPLLPEGSVHCCVTSPPYWGLRDYGTATWEGGDEGCDHRQEAIRVRRNLAEAANACDGGTRKQASRADNDMGIPFRDTCGKCGARRIDAQLGLEPTIDEYVQNMVEVFREVRRVLMDDGTLWLNLGDSYNAYNGNAGPGSGFSHGAACDTQRPKLDSGHGLRTKGLKPKDLCGIPWRVAFALQADGWYLRQDIIWHKPNPMPESVTDRCTKSHEYIFLLSKSQRYYYDHEAIKEPISTAPNAQARGDKSTADRGPREGGNGGLQSMAIRMRDGIETTRNKRSVWTVTTKPFKGAHFATFPPTLIDPCIKAGCPRGGVVLDPFHGSGTCGEVAVNNSCHYIGVELNPEYIDMSLARFSQPRLDL